MPRTTRASKRNAPSSDDEKTSPKPVKKNKKENSTEKENVKTPKKTVKNVAEASKLPRSSKRLQQSTSNSVVDKEPPGGTSSPSSNRRSQIKVKNLANSSSDSGSGDILSESPLPPKGKKSKMDLKSPVESLKDTNPKVKASNKKIKSKFPSPVKSSNNDSSSTNAQKCSPSTSKTQKSNSAHKAKPNKNAKKPVSSPEKPLHGKSKSARLKRTRESVSSVSEEETTTDLPVKKLKAVYDKAPPVILRTPLPRRLSKEELYEQYLSNLCKRLDNYDLSDPTEAKNMFCDWPSEDFYSEGNDGDVSLLNRIWLSDGSTISNNNSNNGLCNGNGQSRGLSVNKNRSSNELDVVSYNVGHMTEARDVEKLINELKEINADIYCFQDVQEQVGSSLVDVIKSVGCTHSSSNYGSFIAFNKENFERLEFRELDVYEAALNVINSSAYPSTWRQSIHAAIQDSDLVSSRFVSLCILRHRASNIILIVATQSKNSNSLKKMQVNRPDIMALNVTGVMWSISRVWQEVCDKYNHVIVNSNGLSRNGDTVSTTSSQCRWIFCGPLNASQDSPIYQLCKDGYPNDDTLNRLRCVLTVQLPHHPPMVHPPINPEDSAKDNSYIDEADDKNAVKKKALVDLIWNAFQHPCTDVISCNQAVIGREPPFTRYVPNLSGVQSKPIVESKMKCLDYIWCSGATLKPKAVLLPPCRALMSDLREKHTSNVLSDISKDSIMSTSIPLVARMNLIVPQV